MFTTSEVDRFVELMNEKQGTRRKKLTKIWGFFFVLVLFLIGLFILIFPGQFKNEETVWILPVYGSIAFLVTLTGLLVSMGFNSEKPYFEYLYPELYQKLNFDETKNLEYQSYVKGRKEFNKRGGLFTSWANVSVKRAVKGTTDNQIPFEILDCSMTTSNGKSQQTHFDGVYFIINKNLNTSVQIRSNGSPKLKGTKFLKQEVSELLKVYKQENQNMSNIDHSLLRYMERLNEYEEYKRIYLGVTDDEIHVALWYKKHPARKMSSVDRNTLDRVYNVFVEELKMIEDITNIDAY